jgi:hypothetical protein
MVILKMVHCWNVCKDDFSSLDGSFKDLGMIVLRIMAEAFRTIYSKNDKCTRE